MAGETALVSRRAFMGFLAASPAIYAAGYFMGQKPSDLSAPQVISRASEAINVFDMHEAAKRAL